MTARRRSTPVVALALLVAIGPIGCVNNRVVVPYSPDTVGSAKVTPVEGPPMFDYERVPIVFDNHDIDSNSDFDVKLISFPSAGKNGQEDNLVTARYYRSRGASPKKLVIILPIWGSKHEYPAEKLSRVVRSRSDGDTNVLMVLGERRLFDMDQVAAAQDVETFRATVTQMLDRCRNSIIDVRRIVDWAEAQPDIDIERIALIGLSIGAIIGSVAALVEPRISTTVLVMGGARPWEILAQAVGRTAEGRDVVLERFGWTIEQYEAEIRNVFHVLDASLWAEGNVVDPANVLMFDAMYDERMPKSSRDALWEAMGRPERITLKYGHGYSFFSMTPLGKNYTSNRIWDFLEQKL